MVEIIDETNRYLSTNSLSTNSLSTRSLSIRRLQTILNRFLRDLKVTQTVTLILCDDATIQKMNLADRGEDYATDVLSYPTMEPGDIDMPEIDHLGDVFISLDTAQKQAVTHYHDLESEVLTLAAHGITHLRGFDHSTEDEWSPFQAAQKRVLELRTAKR
jgi:probable rRNA maturation factor